jgi:hypothetical protein
MRGRSGRRHLRATVQVMCPDEGGGPLPWRVKFHEMLPNCRG